MKSLLLVVGLMFSLNLFSQFLAPSNFVHSGTYTLLGEQGFCLGKMVIGPANCTHFYWNKPNTGSTSAKIESYKIYNNDYNTTTVIATVVDTSYEVGLGYVGSVWVTAVYSNPNGESNASNIISGLDLPTFAKNLNTSLRTSILYNMEQQIITLKNVKNPKGISVIDCNSKIVKSVKSKESINIFELPAGLYVIEVTYGESKIIRRKIIK